MERIFHPLLQLFLHMQQSNCRIDSHMFLETELSNLLSNQLYASAYMQNNNLVRCLLRILFL